MSDFTRNIQENLNAIITDGGLVVCSLDAVVWHALDTVDKF